jgi:hypothetical protein
MLMMELMTHSRDFAPPGNSSFCCAESGERWER